MKTILIFAIATVLLWWFMTPAEKDSGSIVLVGGGQMPVGLFEWVTSHKPEGRFLLVSEDGTYGPKWNRLFEYGEVDILIPEQLTEDRLKGTGAIFIDGGHQYEYLSRLNKSVLQKAHEQGTLILGTSAGSMILGEFYFSAKNGTITSEEAVADPNNEKICLGWDFLKIPFLRNTLVDSHYTERGREGRLAVFLDKVFQLGLRKGIGIDESTALCVTPHDAIVIGKGGVHIVSKTTQGNNCTSLYQHDTSSNFHVSEYSGQNP